MPPNGELTSLRMPGAVVDSMRYDLEGRTVWRREMSPAHPNVPLQHETFTYDARGKVLAVSVPATVQRNASSTFVQWYTGLGSLAMTDWVNSDNPHWQRERFTTDALGNSVWRRELRTAVESPGNDHPDYKYTMNPFFGRVTKVERVDPEGYGGSMPPVDESSFSYDESGSQITTYQRSGPGGGVGFTHMVDTRSFYGADQRLRAFQKYDDQTGPNQSTSSGIFEEYRYDPLGRRVAVRTLRPQGLCNQPTECFNTTTFYVWAGDQLLWEIRDTDASADAETRGRVSYFQAGGIDRPLTIWKQGEGTVVTHQSWRGQFARGTFGVGPKAGQSSDCTEYPATNGCIPVQWPGWNTTAWSQEAAKPNTIGSDRFWFGSLSVGMRDASGQTYMRNRYYNAQTGQFTQPDPIGLAGGLNGYGFAAGDPVSYNDPFGLKVCYEGSATDIRLLRETTERATNTSITLDEDNCIRAATPLTNGKRGYRSLQTRLNAVIRSHRRIAVRYSTGVLSASAILGVVRIPAPGSLVYQIRYLTGNGIGCFGGRNKPPGVHTPESLLVHELLGHMEGPLWARTGLPPAERRANRVENEYHRAVGETERCDWDTDRS